MTAPAARRRPRQTGGAQTLARLTAAREQLDADSVTRRQREDGLLREYAAVVDAVSAATTRRDTVLEELERRARQVRATAETELEALEGRRGRVLAALNADRSADELAQLVGLPPKRVRTLLRAHRVRATAADPAPTGVTATPQPEGSTPAPVVAPGPRTPVQVRATGADHRTAGDADNGAEGPGRWGSPPGPRPSEVAGLVDVGEVVGDQGAQLGGVVAPG